MKLVFARYSTLIVFVCAVPSAAFAQSAAKVEALQHLDRGLSLVKSGAYGEAIAEFNQSYDLGHDFAALHDIGKAYIAIEQPVHAVKALRRYLSEGGKRIPSARRRQVEAEIAKQEARIATVTISTMVSGAVLRVDGMEMGKTPLSDGVRIMAGTHVFTAAAEGYRPWQQNLALLGGERKTLEIQFELNASTAPVTVTPPPAGPQTPTGAGAATQAPLPVAGAIATQAPPSAPGTAGGSKTVGYVLGGLGIGALAVGAVYGARAISKRHDSNDQCPQNQCSPTGVELNNQAKTAARVADITIGVGLVSVAVATYLLLRSPKSEASPPAASAQETRLVAGVGPGEAHLALGGSW
jgi:hypothetical protein